RRKSGLWTTKQERVFENSKRRFREGKLEISSCDADAVRQKKANTHEHPRSGFRNSRRRGHSVQNDVIQQYSAVGIGYAVLEVDTKFYRRRLILERGSSEIEIEVSKGPVRSSKDILGCTYIAGEGIRARSQVEPHRRDCSGI